MYFVTPLDYCIDLIAASDNVKIQLGQLATWLKDKRAIDFLNPTFGETKEIALARFKSQCCFLPLEVDADLARTVLFVQVRVYHYHEDGSLKESSSSDRVRLENLI